jgi:hypothetical protein
MTRLELVEKAVESATKAMQKGAKRNGYWLDPLIILCNDVLAEYSDKLIYLKGNGQVKVGVRAEIEMNGVFGKPK